MRIEIPSGARLQNIEMFVRQVTEPDTPDLQLIIPRSYFALHPVVVCAIAAAGVRAIREGASINVPAIPQTHPVRYLARMGLFDVLGVAHPFAQTEHEPAGRFIPLRTVGSGRELSDFIVDLAPLFHADPEQAEPVKYVLAELVRNTLEHGGLGASAVAMAQAFPRAGTVGIGVVDTGQGILSSLRSSHSVERDLEAIHLAMRPGITGATRRIGGNAENAGAGLFFCKSLAYISREYFVIWSGNGIFKLLKRRDRDRAAVKVRGDDDRATRHEDLGKWPGTLVGIDIASDAYATFAGFMKQMRETYGLDVRAQKKQVQKKRARFS